MKTPTIFVLSGAMLGLVVPVNVYAQAPSAPASTVRVQVRTMENVFMTAVQGGVEQIAKKIVDAAPGLTVSVGVPRAHGYAIEGQGWFFDVEVPELRWNTIGLYYELQRPQAPQRSVGNNSSRVQGALVAPQEPDTDQLRDEYRKAIREGLMDAILDFGHVPLTSTESLTVGVRSADSPVPSLDDNDTVTLVMQITGEDLALFRQTKITRDEAKKRIKVKEEQR